MNKGYSNTLIALQKYTVILYLPDTPHIQSTQSTQNEFSSEKKFLTSSIWLATGQSGKRGNEFFSITSAANPRIKQGDNTFIGFFPDQSSEIPVLTE